MMTPTSKRGNLPDLLISAFLKAPLTSLEAVTKQELQNTVFPGLAELTTQHMWRGALKIALCCLTSLSSNLKVFCLLGQLGEFLKCLDLF